MIVLRYETEEGEGIFRSGEAQAKLTGIDYEVATRHSLPSEDPVISDWYKFPNQRQWFFGMTEEQLPKLFSTEVQRAFASAGFCLVRYETNDFVLGETQVVFLKHLATRLSS